MKACTQADSGSEPVRQASKARALRSPYQASGALGHPAHLAEGVAIGSIIVLLFWLAFG